MKASRAGLRTIAAIEATKGILVLIVCIGVTRLTKSELARLAEEIVAHFHLDPTRRMASIFLKVAEDTSDARLQFYAALAAVYAMIRFAEAWGLWQQRVWAEWVGVIGAAIYIPFELIQIVRRPHSLHFILLALNLFLVAYLLAALKARRGSPAVERL